MLKFIIFNKEITPFSKTSVTFNDDTKIISETIQNLDA